MSLTAVDLIRCSIVSTVVVAITNKAYIYAAAIGTGKLGGWVTCGEGAAALVTVVATVVCVVTDVA